MKRESASRSPARSTTRAARHTWGFPTRFRRGAFGWKASRLAVERIHEAVAEISRVARSDPTLGAEGAVRLIEKLSPALEHVDSSSGALGSAVNGALERLVPVIAEAPVPSPVREKWLERLFEAHAADQIPYIEQLADYWGELCVTPELASKWADELIGITRMALSPDKSVRGHFHGTTACLSALLTAGRYVELEELLREEGFWPYKRWAVKALAAQGTGEEAIALAEASRGPWTSEGDVNRLCEGILLSLGRVEEAYRKYGLRAHRARTYVETFREVSRHYPDKQKSEILRDLIAEAPAEEGKWFATAKSLGELNLALELAENSPVDPRTLARAARDFVRREPAFALGAALAALKWLTQGHGYEITVLDVRMAYDAALVAAERLRIVEETQEKIRRLVSSERPGGFVRQVLGQALQVY